MQKLSNLMESLVQGASLSGSEALELLEVAKPAVRADADLVPGLGKHGLPEGQRSSARSHKE
ncbi:MAG: hypothetical protein Q7U73_00020 [Rubrivivax sp.]|nr:hypothetical protein [Rubrivivax sp.]